MSPDPDLMDLLFAPGFPVIGEGPVDELAEDVAGVPIPGTGVPVRAGARPPGSITITDGSGTTLRKLRVRYEWVDGNLALTCTPFMPVDGEGYWVGVVRHARPRHRFPWFMIGRLPTRSKTLDYTIALAPLGIDPAVDELDFRLAVEDGHGRSLR